MQVDFKIVSYHRLSPEQVSGMSVEQEAKFGRSQGNDWYLPDPEKVVSGTHAVVRKEGDDFYIYDKSTNGLYINRGVEALGNKKHKLADGDLLSIGDYEITTELCNNEKTKGSATTSAFDVNAVEAMIKEPIPIFTGDVLKVTEPKREQVLPVVNNDLNDHYCIPTSIPEEWDLNSIVNNTDAFSVEQKIIPEKKSIIPATSSMKPGSRSNKQPAEPLGSVLENSKIEKVNTIALAPRTDHTSRAMEAFIKGLGISNKINPAGLSDEIYFELGQSMNLMLNGLIKSLRTRASLKNEFKINQTIFQQQENNPLKFSASIDDVFQNLYLYPSNSFLSSKRAIEEVFNDTEKHDKALAAGTLGALQGLLEQLDPKRIQEKNSQEHYLDKIIPKNMQARNWNIYQQLHEHLHEEISIHGSSALIDYFVKAYDQKMKSQ